MTDSTQDLAAEDPGAEKVTAPAMPARAIEATAAQIAAAGADVRLIAATAVSTWRDIDAALSLVIGRRGFAALYRRSLRLTSADHPCLAAASDGDVGPGRFAALQTALAQQAPSPATAANDALLRTFRDLLSQLIGLALTARLLGPLINYPTSAARVQEARHD